MVTRKHYKLMWPGTRWDNPPKCFKVLAMDDGNEFKAEFGDGLDSDGTEKLYTLPKRPNSHAYIENMNKQLIRGTIAYLIISGCPYPFWSLAARM